jgi:hypothetical protein
MSDQGQYHCGLLEFARMVGSGGRMQEIWVKSSGKCSCFF